MRIIKLVNFEGKLFGLINVLDLFFIVLIILVFGGIIYSRIYLEEKIPFSGEDPNKTSWIIVEVINENIPISKVQYLESKPSEKDNQGTVIAKIITIESSPTHLTHIISPDELYLFPVNPENKNVKALIEILGKKAPKGYTFKDEPLIAGKKITFDFGFCNFEGSIISIHDHKNSD
ncbi:DUF4330 domain-containing protein [bacterium]|nr:DUF4330 domain-containing protein [bacterium]